MNFISLLARLLLTAIFGVAGAAKLFDRKGSGQAMREFGIPALFAPSLGVMLPLVEIVVALFLLPAFSARWAALGALALLCLFIAGIGFNLAKGRAPDCHCFGQIHSAPVSRATLLRNASLMLPSAFVIWRGADGVSAIAWLENLTAAERANLVIGLVVVSLLTALVVFARRIVKGQRDVLFGLKKLAENLGDTLNIEDDSPIERDDIEFPTRGLPVGTFAPRFSLPDLANREVSLTDLLADGKSLLLMFVSPTCPPCLALLPEVEMWQQRHRALNIALISTGELKANREKFTGHDAERVLLQKTREVAEMYQANWTPCAVLINEDGKIGSELAVGAESIRALGMKILTESAALVS